MTGLIISLKLLCFLRCCLLKDTESFNFPHSAVVGMFRFRELTSNELTDEELSENDLSTSQLVLYDISLYVQFKQVAANIGDCPISFRSTHLNLQEAIPLL